MTDWPFWVAYVFLLFGSTCRGQMIYWLGRWATVQTLNRTHPATGWRKKAHDWLSGEGTERGIDALRRWGLIMVPIGHLTIGFQSMINAGAGVLRIPWWKYSLAQLPGSLAWALIYSTIGFAIWGAVIAAFAGSPAGLVIIGAVLVLVVGTFVVHRARRKVARAAEEAAAEATEASASAEVSGEAPVEASASTPTGATLPAAAEDPAAIPTAGVSATEPGAAMDGAPAERTHSWRT